MAAVRAALILGLLTAGVSLEAEIRFPHAAWMPDIGLELALPDGFAADPVEMPRASAYLSTDREKNRLEDRFEVLDLWISRTVRGRWRGARGAVFTIARLDSRLPDNVSDKACTRLDFQRELKSLSVRDAGARDEAVAALVLDDLLPPVRTRRNGRRNFIELWRYPSINEATLVYAFRPRTPEAHETPPWYVVSLTCAPDEDLAAVAETFDAEFLESVTLPAARQRTGIVPPPDETATETDWLAEDYRRTVANYGDWHFVRSGDLMITDDLDGASRLPFIGTLTNELPRLRREYAAAVPPAVTDGFHPAAIRVFRSREEYLAYVGMEANWTAAVWSPERRELVLYLSENGVDELLRTVWHEAFHQYLAYAGAMISASPWLNEGYAELFEHAHFDGNGRLVFEREADYAAFVNLNAPQLANALPAVLAMDYEEFYAGDAFARQSKYRLAWSMAYFLQVGAPELRFRPFEKTCADYMAELVKSRRADAATQRVLSGDKRDDFIDAWLHFWRKD